MKSYHLSLTVLLVCICTSLMAQSSAVVGESDRVPVGGRVHPMANPKYDIGRADSNLRMQRMTLALDPSLAHRAGGSAPGSSSAWTMGLHSSSHPGTASFSAGPDQRLQAVTAWLRSYGLVIEPFHGGRPAVTFSGTVAQVEEFFQVEIRNYLVNGKTYYANVNRPSVPRSLSGLIRGVHSLDNFPPVNDPAPSSGYSESVLYNFSGTLYTPAFGGIIDSNGNLYGTSRGGGTYGAGTIFKVSPAGAETVLYSFTHTNGDGINPSAGLYMDGAGNLYGTAGGGNSCNGYPYGCGIVFKLNSAGQETVLYRFTGTNGDGISPNGGLIMDNAGNLYGTTADGGSANLGTVFKVTPAGVETVLYSFTGAVNNDGAVPQAGLFMDSLGNLYGTTLAGGYRTSPCDEYSSGCGTVFKLSSSGQETVLHIFTGMNGDGYYPEGGLIMDSAGNLEGTTWGGGSAGGGTLFTISPAGQETVLYSFGSTLGDGTGPMGGLITDSAGNMYGITTAVGSDGWGAVFKLTSAGAETVLYNFIGEPAGPFLARDSAGNFYGSTFSGGSNGGGTVFKVDAAGNETALYSFPYTNGDGANPEAGLVMDSAGNLYGTTVFNGYMGNPCAAYSDGCGTVFKLSSSGQEAVFFSFGETNAGFPSDGEWPYGSLIVDSAGNLYGTTSGGGDGASCSLSVGCGTVFEVSSSGQETVLYSFGGTTEDGINPVAGLIVDSDGNLYGTTEDGGSANNGTVFKLTPAGVETVLHSFTGVNGDGANPVAGLIMDSAGNLYGTTEYGGSGTGTVFKVTSAGAETVLYSFSGANGDGAYPRAGLITDSAGNLYGTTYQGGLGAGTVFKVTPAGAETVVYSFGTDPNDGGYPEAGLVMDSAGNLYGTTIDSSSGQGTVFKVTPAGAQTTLYSFTGTNGDGSIPMAGLVWDSLGNLYGTTESGGTADMGTVFKLTTPAPNFTLSAGAPNPSPVTQGQPANSTITVTSANGFRNTVTFTCSGLPVGASCSPASATPAGNGTATATLTITTSTSTPVGSSTVTVAGTSGLDVQTTTLTLTVQGPPTFTVSAGALNPGPVTQGQSASSTLTVTSVNGFSNTVTLTCSGLPAGASCGPASATPASNGTATATLTISTSDSTPVGNSTVIVTGTSGSDVQTTTLTLTVQGPPTFTVSAGALSPSSVTPGLSASSTITVTSVNDFNSAVNVTCSVSPSPSRAPSCAFSANSVTPAANGTATPTLMISTTASTASVTPATVGREGKLFDSLWLPMPFMVLLGASLRYNFKKRKWLGMLLGLVLTAGLTAQLGCGGSSSQGGGGGNSGTPTGNYTITVTATSGPTTKTTTVTLSVQ